MLGTPNFGALSQRQLGLLSQLVLKTTRKVYGVFRRSGVLQLTDVPRVLHELIKTGAAYAEPVEYVTIPGAYFHEGRSVLDRGAPRSGRSSSWFRTLALSAELLTALQPVWKVNLERPHDGIVERRSNSFVPEDFGRRSEKSLTINHAPPSGRTYAHLEPAICEELTHVMIQHDPEVIEVVRSLLMAPSLEDWHRDLENRIHQRLRVAFS